MYRQNGTPYRIGLQYELREEPDARLLAYALINIARTQTGEERRD
jgi:hypothetical protein